MGEQQRHLPRRLHAATRAPTFPPCAATTPHWCSGCCVRPHEEGVSRLELADRIGLTPQAVSKITARLRADGMVAEAGRRASTGGKPATVLRLVPGARHAVGLHLDRDELTAVLADLAGEAVAVRRAPLAFEAGAGQVLATAGREVAALRAEAGGPPVLGAGVACPGPLDHLTGVLHRVTGAPRWDGFPLRDALAERLGLPVVLDKDTNAAALGLAHGIPSGSRLVRLSASGHRPRRRARPGRQSLPRRAHRRRGVRPPDRAVGRAALRLRAARLHRGAVPGRGGARRPAGRGAGAGRGRRQPRRAAGHRPGAARRAHRPGASRSLPRGRGPGARRAGRRPAAGPVPGARCRWRSPGAARGRSRTGRRNWCWRRCSGRGSPESRREGAAVGRAGGWGPQPGRRCPRPAARLLPSPAAPGCRPPVAAP